MTKLKILTIVGTRPEIIRLAEIIKKLDIYSKHILVNSGQNFDYNLSKVFFNDLELRKPDYNLKCNAKNLSQQLGMIIERSGELLEKIKPDAIIVLGDTNSALSTIPAKRLGIPIFHLEAGDRCFDKSNPEETNRKIVDHIADYNLVYTENSRRNLLREGIHSDKIFLMGSPISEVYHNLLLKKKKSNILTKLNLKKKMYFAASIHREETVDIEENFMNLISCFNFVAQKYKLPIIVSTHPRTKRKLKTFKGKKNKLVIWHKPFGLIDYITLQINSKCVVSDSGTIHEDSAVLNFPAVAVRNSTEKKEALEKGVSMISGYHKDNLINQIKMSIELKNDDIPKEYKIKKVSDNVCKLILGLSKIKKANHY